MLYGKVNVCPRLFFGIFYILLFIPDGIENLSRKDTLKRKQ
jgi:hypothetical protein